MPLRTDGLSTKMNEARCRSELCGQVPAWRDVAIAIVPAATYLGYRVVPSVGRQEAWRGCIGKYRLRAKGLATGRMAPSSGVRLHDCRAAPVLSYVSQVTAAPSSLRAAYRTVVEQLLHLPHKSLPRTAAGPMRAMQAPIPRGTEPLDGIDQNVGRWLAHHSAVSCGRAGLRHRGARVAGDGARPRPVPQGRRESQRPRAAGASAAIPILGP